MDYSHPLRRRTRVVGRLLRQSVNPAVWKSAIVVPTYWWDGWLNFGDTITPWLLPKLGVGVIHADPPQSELCATGSLIQDLPREWSGDIWGSGLIEDRKHVLPSARVLAVRGALSAERMGLSEPVPLGDPGLLVSQFIAAPAKRWDLAIVPHAYHYGSTEIASLAARFAKHRRVRVVNVRRGVRTVAREIAASNFVISTSLHGVVTADSFGIPAVWTLMDPGVEGGAFKFRDYETAVTPDTSRFIEAREIALTSALESLFSMKVPRDRVGAVCDGLIAALKQHGAQRGGESYLTELQTARRRKHSPA